jgi:hypothetical protein
VEGWNGGVHGMYLGGVSLLSPPRLGAGCAVSVLGLHAP